MKIEISEKKLAELNSAIKYYGLDEIETKSDLIKFIYDLFDEYTSEAEI